MDAPPETGGTPATAPGHRRLRDHRLHILLGPTSGQPSCFHGPQAGREKQVIARLTASGHASDAGERAIANDRTAPPDGQGNVHAHGGSGSGQKTATAHAESGHGVTDTDPRIETSHDATESHHAESGSGQKTVSDHEKSVTRTMTASHAHDRLTANGKRSESESDSDVHES